MQTKKHIVMLQAAHRQDDDRVFYHQAKTLTEEGHQVEICDFHSFPQFQPSKADIYIVDSPKAIWKIRKIPTKIVYDITEWYPSKKNIRYLRWGKLSKTILLVCANLWAGHRVDAFIFGEKDKAAPFRFLYPKKLAIDLSYYPNLDYIPTTQQRDISKQCNVLYAGPLTEEKGFYRVIETMTMVAQEHPNIQWSTTIISSDQHAHTSLPENLRFTYLKPLPFQDFCAQLHHYDLFLDLRDCDFENTRCLPIKLFYYMAAGRPSIFSNLRAITTGIPEILDCAHLVQSPAQAAQAIATYVNNPQIYYAHCKKALQLATTQYHWKNIKHRLIQLINAL
jgi:glycosyltransferase involved in cell wall biosynthesis